MTSTRLATGVFRDRYGFRVIWTDRGRQREKRFPADTPLDRLKAWRRQKVRDTADLASLNTTGSFVRDVVRFLRGRKGLASFKSDRAHLRAWVHRFVRLSRWAITPDLVREALAEWRVAGYSVRTLRHRIRVLEALFHALDGPTAATPCDGLTLPAPPKTRPVSVADGVVREVALQLYKQEAIGRLHDGKTRARFLVLATTGQRPAQLRRAQPIDVDLERRIWIVRPAKGDQGSVVYLNDDMLAAWRLFVQARAWGAYDTRSFVKTLQRNGWPKGVRPYNLRHTVGLSLSELGVDLGDIQAVMGHTDINTTRRFYVPALASRLKEASAKLDARQLVTPATAQPYPDRPARRPARPGGGRKGQRAPEHATSGKSENTSTRRLRRPVASKTA